MSEPIGAAEFATRLAAICLSGNSTFPRRARDIQILLASATLWMEDGRVYSESQINDGLRDWLGSVCPHLRIDEVTLRRELVDNLYLQRDDSGTNYSPGPGPAAWHFSAEVAGIHPGSIIEEEQARRAARRASHVEPGSEGG